MSHEATNWAITVRGLRPITRIVLWHLADCHNPALGCFPTQAYLAERCEISRASVNRCLDELEERQMIRRLARIHPTTKKQLNTRYFLACEKDFEPQHVASRVSGLDTAPGGGDDAAACDDFGGEAVENGGKTDPARVSEIEGAVSQSYETLTCKEPINPLPPETGKLFVTFSDLLGKWPEADVSSLDVSQRIRAQHAFGRLPPQDQIKAVELVEAYRVGLYQLKRPLPRLSAYVADRLFEEFDKPPPIENGLFQIARGCPEWDRWIRALRVTHPRQVDALAKQPFIAVPTRWPDEASTQQRRAS